mgnify:CR=1 FL=1|jgi:hypothetical protein|tara:strand:+ start:1870 stop:2115 length:246 start_codon:yes stop_codon:yes gene_type:complete
MKLLTLEDYQLAGQTFWPKYWYVAKELGESAKTEDILKCMEAIGNVALKLALEEKSADPFGFNKNGKDGDDSDEPRTESID